MAVFALFSKEKGDWSVEEAAAEIGIPVSSAYRYVRTLAEEDLIVAMDAGRYVLGPRIIVLDRKMRLSDPLILATEAVLQQFEDAMTIDGVLLLCRLFRDQVVCIHTRVYGEPTIHVSYERGRPMPLYRGAASRVILANLPSRTLRKLFDDNPSSFAESRIGDSWEEVKLNLRGAREAGAMVTYGEVDPGAVGTAAPIFARDGAVIGSLGYAAASNTSDADKSQIINVLTKMTAAVDKTI